MAARIQSFCPAARIQAVCIAQKQGDDVAVRVHEQALAMGISWCVDHGIKIINVSYSIAEVAEDGELYGVCQKADENGAIVVAAYRNGEHRPVYPAAFPTVIGVRRRDGLGPGEVALMSEDRFDLFAWGRSNSMATAQVSVMVGRIHSVDDSLALKQVFAFLAAIAVP